MHHSQSTGSISSLGIGASQSCNNLAAFSQYQQPSSSPNLSGSVPDLNIQGNSGKLVHSQMSSNDSDPDYNVTLTAESLRQTIQHQMEVDSPPTDQGHQSAPIFSPQILLPNQKPQFFIDPSMNNFIGNQPPPQAECQKQQQIKAARYGRAEELMGYGYGGMEINLCPIGMSSRWKSRQC